MIDKLTYDEVLKISKELSTQANIVEKVAKERDMQEIIDFAATVEGYSKYLETTVAINKDADEALKELKSHMK